VIENHQVLVDVETLAFHAVAGDARNRRRCQSELPKRGRRRRREERNGEDVSSIHD
jgi:hypothetical protein